MPCHRQAQPPVGSPAGKVELYTVVPERVHGSLSLDPLLAGLALLGTLGVTLFEGRGEAAGYAGLGFLLRHGKVAPVLSKGVSC